MGQCCSSSAPSDSNEWSNHLRYFPEPGHPCYEVCDYIELGEEELSRLYEGEEDDESILEDERLVDIAIYQCDLKQRDTAAVAALVTTTAAGAGAAAVAAPEVTEQLATVSGKDNQTTESINNVTQDASRTYEAGTVAVASASGGCLALGGIFEIISCKAHHVFVAVRTEKWAYIFTKGQACVELHKGRLTDLTALMQKEKQFVGEGMMVSSEPQLRKTDTGVGSLKDVTDWIKETGQLDLGYNWARRNCKDFAYPIFNKFAANERIFHLRF